MFKIWTRKKVQTVTLPMWSFDFSYENFDFYRNRNFDPQPKLRIYKSDGFCL